MAEPPGPGWLAGLAGALKPADYLRLARELKGGAEVPGASPVRVALLSSHSLGFVEPFLRVEGARQGLKVEPYFGAFGQFEQELAGADAPAIRFAPDVLVLALRPEDVDVDAVVRYHATAGARFAQLAGELIQRLAGCVRAFREHSRAPVLVANFAAPATLPFGFFDANIEGAFSYALARANEQLRQQLAASPGTVLWDYAGLVRERGVARWTDQRLWALGRVAVAGEHQPALGAHLARAVAGVRRKPAKCLVLDLDNTLWGGVIGDDGAAGIQLGDDYPGSAYKEFQRMALALRDRGVLLAVASKNDHAVVEQTFREHPEMLIRWEHLAATRINWEPKSASIRAIADELNIGADALVFFDDNPVERAEVRAGAPEVTVIEAPTDPLAYGRALLDSGAFDQLTLSAEDATRGEMYRRDRERQDTARQFTSVEDFLVSLGMEAEVGTVDAATLPRVAQLIGKTNQFNLTTRRHDQAAVAAMAADAGHAVAWLRLTDRFGDQGLVCVGIVRRDAGLAVLDTFLMSCRVMNRHVEQAMMSFLLEQARRLGCTRAEGVYLPTKKNGMVRGFYPGLGFHEAGPADEGGTRFTLDLAREDVAWPAAIRRAAPA